MYDFGHEMQSQFVAERRSLARILSMQAGTAGRFVRFEWIPQTSADAPEVRLLPEVTALENVTTNFTVSPSQ